MYEQSRPAKLFYSERRRSPALRPRVRAVMEVVEPSRDMSLSRVFFCDCLGLVPVATIPMHIRRTA